MKKEKNSENSFFVKLSTVIVDKRNIILVLYVAAFIFSMISKNWVAVCDDITSYLPKNTETRQGLTIMEDEFTTYATSKVMIINTTYDEAKDIETKLKDLGSVSIVAFDDSEDHYKDGCSLFDITLTTEEGDPKTQEGYSEIREILSDYDTYISESDSDDSAALDSEMNVVFLIAAVIIVSVLLFTSQTYAEVPVMILTFITAAILNTGTNFFLGEISFVSNSVTTILQLALSIDYAIIMIHHYSEEREHRKQRDAVIYALSKSIPEISASSLTTISGLAALMFMQFKIGFDMGICLIKAIALSLLSVFTMMPCLLMLFGKYIDKTHHKNIVPDISGLGSIVYKLRVIVPPIFVAVIISAYFISSHCPYVYDLSSPKTDRQNEIQIAQRMIDDTFGSENMAALVFPTGDYDKEKALIKELETYDEIVSITALSSVEASDGYVLTDKLTPRQFAELTDIDIELSKLLYATYATDHEDYSQLVGNMENFGVPLIDMFSFVYDLKEDGYVHFDSDVDEALDDLHIQLDNAKKQLSGDKYARMLVYLDLPTEGEETFAFIDTVHNICKKYYDESYFVGNSTSSYDLSTSFAKDNIVVSVLSILFVIAVLFFTFKSAGLPILLIAVIQGSIWINFSLPTITGNPMYFLSYLIVSSIQMGANIDYAIVISSRYMELRGKVPIKKAMQNSLNFAFPTVLTSGSILASAGFLIGKLSTQTAIVSIGKSLCSGTLISMFLVMCVLPEILLLGDTIIEKTKVTINTPEIVHKETGRFVVNGRVRGYINGYVDADIHGVVRGDMSANVNINNILPKSEEGETDNEPHEE